MRRGSRPAGSVFARTGRSVTAAERGELVALLEAMGTPTGPAKELSANGGWDGVDGRGKYRAQRLVQRRLGQGLILGVHHRFQVVQPHHYRLPGQCRCLSYANYRSVNAVAGA
jgi:hypothetical protein